jgi:hypothetical protein
MQTLLDEKRSGQVNEVLLETLTVIKDGLKSSLSPAAFKHASNSSHARALVFTGTEPPPRAVQQIGSTASCRVVAPDEVDAASSVVLACGGMDVVVFVRHNGLPYPADPGVAFVQYPDPGGVLCVPHLASTSSGITSPGAPLMFGSLGILAPHTP